MNLTEEQIDVIQEIINIGTGQAANLMNTLSGKHVNLSVPKLQILTIEQYIDLLSNTLSDKTISSVSLNFSGLLKGIAKLFFPTDQATRLVFAFTEEHADELDFDEIQAETLSEIGNIVLNSLVGSISNILKINVSYSIPLYLVGNINEIISADKLVNKNNLILYARTHFIIDEILISGDFILIINCHQMETFLDKINFFIEQGGFFNQ
ncbi:MAG: chemotaxis protein CheC [Candidatus Kapaibacteriales bacterium]